MTSCRQLWSKQRSYLKTLALEQQIDELLEVCECHGILHGHWRHIWTRRTLAQFTGLIDIVNQVRPGGIRTQPGLIVAALTAYPVQYQQETTDRCLRSHCPGFSM